MIEKVKKNFQSAMNTFCKDQIMYTNICTIFKLTIVLIQCNDNWEQGIGIFFSRLEIVFQIFIV